MTEEAREQTEAPVHVNHYCEFPGCTKWGGLGYDVHPAGTQWFCFEHRWLDYKLGKGARSFFEEETLGIEAVMSEPRAVASG
ncbi:hypothetical protein N2601_31115 (plasmid) [Rhizobium sp. CB3060]|uniref:hypothetical protein n=1 Tax=Rhizobium sp. CB3060 TaxID=3138255 RepID=UPI0021A5C623|nr:hypothetical protein [Rhizobium tropici]UWU25441.1 hypothetical protein N2601_31115 [Rhizobium tropici]